VLRTGLPTPFRFGSPPNGSQETGTRQSTHLGAVRTRSAGDLDLVRAERAEAVGGKGAGPFEYCVLEVSDDPWADLLSYFPTVCRFISEGVQKGDSATLVHCQAGISRSASCVCSYIMFAEELFVPAASSSNTIGSEETIRPGTRVLEVLNRVREARPIVQPNLGFLRQLRLWERHGALLTNSQLDLTRECRFYALYVLEAARRKLLRKADGAALWKRDVEPRSRRLSDAGLDPALLLTSDAFDLAERSEGLADPQIRPAILDAVEHLRLLEEVAVLECGACAHPLALSDLHVLGQQNEDEILLERMSWMSDIDDDSGDILCPECTQTIGRYVWPDDWDDLGAFTLLESSVGRGRRKFPVKNTAGSHDSENGM
jgi:Dual specificity phosphatase, catalytic domain